MKQVNALSSSSKATIGALLVGAAGFAIQIISGVEVPTIPPGLVMMVAAAAVIVFLPRRWVPVVGAAVGLFLLVGFSASGAVGNLLDPGRIGVFTGAWLQFLALIVAVIAGVGATIGNYREKS